MITLSCTNCGASIVAQPYKAKQPRIFCSRRCKGLFHAEVAAKNGRKSSTIHGMHKTATYKSWNSARQRCNNPNDPSYARYGGRGIRMCDAWDSFGRFYSDMKNRPPGMTLDRIDSNGDYTPENCRWATSVTQNRHRRTLISYEGRTMSLKEFADHIGLPYNTLLKRRKNGWSMDKIISTPYLGRGGALKLR